MSFTITTDIFCDVESCAEWLHGTVDTKVDKVVTRQKAKKLGWKVIGNLAICCDCVKRGYGFKSYVLTNSRVVVKVERRT
jgi:hypothetical protein